MAEMTYLDFDLTIRPRVGGGYRVEVVSPNGARPMLDFDLPFLPAEMASFREAISGPARDVRRSEAERRSSEPELRDKVKRFGGILFETVFDSDVRASFMSSLEGANKQGAGLRIRVRTDDAPELADVPWEYLYNRSLQRYLVLSEQTPVVRFIALPNPPATLQVEPPLNILVMLSDPNNYARLAVDEEWTRIRDAFRDLVDAKLVSIDRLPKATTEALQDQLQKKRYHVFHFIGHGGFDPVTNEAGLLMEGPAGEGELVGGDLLRVLLDHFHLRLVVLNSCEGARADLLDPFSGVAQSLVLQGIPAVIAMQFKITDPAAVLFASRFHKAIADSLPVDAALAEARKAIYLSRNPTEWGTPVLFMRSPDGRIFRIDRPTEAQLRQAQIDALARDAQAAIERKEYAVAIEKLKKVLELQEAP